MGFADELSTQLLDLRAQPPIAAALRRASSQATEHYAYPYLARWWGDKSYLRAPVLAIGGLAGQFRDVAQADRSAGAFAADIVLSQRFARNGVEHRLMLAQGGDIDVLVRVLRALLAMGQRSGLGVDWADVARTCLEWDTPATERRRRARRRLLENFYVQLEEQ